MTDLTPRRQIVFDMLVEAAEHGLPCPSDQQIARAIGITGLGAANSHVRKLQEAGLIHITTPGRNKRVVVITGTGKHTALPPDRKARRHVKRETRPAAKANIGGAMLTSEGRMALVKGGPPLAPKRRPETSVPAPRDCQYPSGEAPPYRMCGKPAQHGSSYCQAHHKLCWRQEQYVRKSKRRTA